MKAQYDRFEWEAVAAMGIRPIEAIDAAMEKEIERFDSMSDEELQEYYNTPEGRAELEYELEQLREWRAFDDTPIEERPHPLEHLKRQKLFRRGKLKFYAKILLLVAEGKERKEIANELTVSQNTIKIALREARRLAGLDYKNHQHETFEERRRCPECRGHINRDTRKLYDETLDGIPQPRRKHQQKEIPESRLHLERRWSHSDSGEENHGSYLDRQPGDISSIYNCPVCGGAICDEAEAIEKHFQCAYKLRSNP